MPDELVPVRPQRDLTIPPNKLKHPKKRTFLKFYTATLGHISDSCKAAKINRSTYYHWLEHDEEFKNALMNVEAELNDEARQILIDKWAKGDNTALIFYLKNRHPDFKINKTTNIQVNTYNHFEREKNEYGI